MKHVKCLIGILMVSIAIGALSNAEDTLSTQLRVVEKHNGYLKAIAFSPNGKFLATGGEAVTLWDVSTGASKKLVRVRTGQYGLAFSGDGTRLATASGHEAQIWDVASGTLLQSFKGHTDTVTAVALSPNGDLLATGSEDRTARIWNTTTGETLHTLEKEWVSSVALSPNGRQLATGCKNERAVLWDVATGNFLRVFIDADVFSVSFSPDGKLLATGNFGSATIWDIKTGLPVWGFDELAGEVSVSFSADGQLLSVGDSERVRMWDVGSGQLLTTLEDEASRIVAMSPTSGQAALSGYGVVKLWSVDVVLVPEFQFRGLFVQLDRLTKRLSSQKATFLTELMRTHTSSDTSPWQLSEILGEYEQLFLIVSLRPLVESLDSAFGDQVRANYERAMSEYETENHISHLNDFKDKSRFVHQSLKVLRSATMSLELPAAELKTLLAQAIADPTDAAVAEVADAVEEFVRQHSTLFESPSTAWIAHILQEQAAFLRGGK